MGEVREALILMAAVSKKVSGSIAPPRRGPKEGGREGEEKEGGGGGGGGGRTRLFASEGRWMTGFGVGEGLGGGYFSLQEGGAEKNGILNTKKKRTKTRKEKSEQTKGTETL